MKYEHLKKRARVATVTNHIWVLFPPISKITIYKQMLQTGIRNSVQNAYIVIHRSCDIFKYMKYLFVKFMVCTHFVYCMKTFRGYNFV